MSELQRQINALNGKEAMLKRELASVLCKSSLLEKQLRDERLFVYDLKPLDDLMVIQEFIELPHITQFNEETPRLRYEEGQTVKIDSIDEDGMCFIRVSWGTDIYNVGIGNIPIDIICKMRAAYLALEKWPND